MLEIVPYELDEIKNSLKIKAIEEFGLVDAEFEGSNVSQLINLLAYSTVINNTNFTFGLNEMFITQAKDRRNVIKHARQMGYAHKRKVSYQYKIKLKVLKSGEVTLNKYSKFTSNDNDYVYFGESTTDVYGTNTFLKLLGNEYNNGVKDVYLSSELAPGKLIITEENQVCRVLSKEPVGNPKLLLELIEGGEIPVYSQLGQEIYVADGTHTQGYRNLLKIATLDTFVVDKNTEMFRMQVTLEDGIPFPFQTQVVHPANSVVVSGPNLILSTDTEFLINEIEELILTNPADSEEYNISLSGLTAADRNIVINSSSSLAIEEAHSTVGDNIVISDFITHEVVVTANHNMVVGSLTEVSIVSDGDTYSLLPSEVTVIGNDITIPARSKTATESGITIVGGVVTLPYDTLIESDSVTLTNGVDTVIIDGSNEYSFSYIVDSAEVHILKNGTLTADYDTYTAEIDYDYYVKTENGTITLKYSYMIDVTGFDAQLTYNYTVDNDGYLAKKFFFSDFRGESLLNENSYDSINFPEGWDGFYASDFNAETNVLYFNIAAATQVEIDSGITYGKGFHNPYVAVEGQTLRMDNAITTPFRRTRFSYTEEIISVVDNITVEGYTPYNRDTTFSSILDTGIKDEIEIIVKEGTIKRWNDETEESTPESIILSNPGQTIVINEDMAEAGYFTIQNDNIENDGIELYITRVLSDGTVEYDVAWESRDYLLAEETAGNSRTFVAMSDVDYEDYTNIYTKYAGTGTPLSIDMTAKINILTSKGLEGSTGDLIVPVDTELFQEKYYIEENLTPSVLHIEGSEVQDTDSIRETAPLFSNTANRAVTKNDYKTICEAQPFIQSAQIWGGEEETPVNVPGHIFFSLIPYSRPVEFVKSDLEYSLNKIYNSELFFTTYYQITGKDRYDLIANTEDKNVLFNLLDNYKIITLQLNYIKPIYMDYKLQVKVLKYKFGQTIAETNEEIFENVRKYFVREIESFDSTFYASSLSRYIDEKLGDRYGVTLDVGMSVDLYDSLYEPDRGTFFNATKTDLTDGDNLEGLVGDNDDWRFSMPVDLPIENLFTNSTIINGILISRGRMIVDHITNCNTDNFIIPGDFLYMELDDGTFISHDANGILEVSLPSEVSEVIEINIIYVRNKGIDPSSGDFSATLSSEKFKVGSYVIHRTEEIIRLDLNSHTHWHIDSQAAVTQAMIDDLEEYWNGITMVPFAPYVDVNDTGDLGKLLYKDGSDRYTFLDTDTPVLYTDTLTPIPLYDSEGVYLYDVKDCPLPREYFTNNIRTMDINPKGSNIKSRRNVFSRLERLEFIS